MVCCKVKEERAVKVITLTAPNLSKELNILVLK